jgi:hypothetical protein
MHIYFMAWGREIIGGNLEPRVDVPPSGCCSNGILAVEMDDRLLQQLLAEASDDTHPHSM